MSAIYFKSFNCEITKKGFETVFYPNISCGVKNYGRKVSTIYGLATMRKPVTRFYVRILFSDIN